MPKRKKTAYWNEVAEYYKNPSICENCGKVIEVNDDRTVCQARRLKNCDRTCAGIKRERERKQSVKTSLDLQPLKNSDVNVKYKPDDRIGYIAHCLKEANRALAELSAEIESSRG